MRKKEPQPWERQPREGSAAFAAFQKFLELGPDRNWRQVAQELDAKESRIKTLFGAWKWKDRAIAWEDFLSEINRKREVKVLERHAARWDQRRVNLREEEFDIAEKLLSKARQILELGMIERVESDIVTIQTSDGEITVPTTIIYRPVKVTIKDAATMASTASQLMRISAEMETSRDTVNITMNPESERIRQAKEAFIQARDEIIANLNAKDPSLLASALAELPAWIAESFKIKRETLLLEDGNQKSDMDAEVKPPKLRIVPPVAVDILPDEDEDSSIIDVDFEDIEPTEAVS